MKKYILKPHKRLQICKGNIWLIQAKGLEEAWHFIKDKYFFIAHFIYDPETLIRNIVPEDLKSEEKLAQFIVQSDICLGILTKRGNASIKSMLKVYRIESEYASYMKNQQDKEA